jgi:hypothetical protein
MPHVNDRFRRKLTLAITIRSDRSQSEAEINLQWCRKVIRRLLSPERQKEVA